MILFWGEKFFKIFILVNCQPGNLLGELSGEMKKIFFFTVYGVVVFFGSIKKSSFSELVLLSMGAIEGEGGCENLDLGVFRFYFVGGFSPEGGEGGEKSWWGGLRFVKVLIMFYGVFRGGGRNNLFLILK